MSKEQTLSINNKKVPLTKPDKVLFPEQGITKADIMDYYRRIWPYAAPYIADRPLVMQRFPDGIEEKGFFQKKIPDYFPEWVETIKVKVKEKAGTDHYVNCNSEETLAYLANQGAITLHTWLSKKEHLNNPDRLAFDFDPSDEDFSKVKKAAFTLKKFLDNGNVDSYLMTTGSKGVHVFVHLKPENTFEEVHKVAKALAEKVVESDKGNFTTETLKDKRKDKVFIDYLRNSYAQTTVMPYSLRALKNAPIAVPLSWDELKNNDAHPQKYNIKNIFRRLSQKDDPWKEMSKSTVKLSVFKEEILNSSSYK